MAEQPPKSNAPWILGIVGFALSIPQVICSILCASAAAAAANASNDAGSSEAAGTFATAGFVFFLPVITTFVCFILSFFGKSKACVATGVIMTLASLVGLYANFVNWSLFGIAGAICFLIGGLLSIANKNKA